MLGWWRRWRARREAEQVASAPAASPGDPDREFGEGLDGEPGDEPGDEPDPDAELAPALTDELDLHTFLPRECADVVEEYVRAAQEAGFRTVRIVHGKGKGTLRRIVHGVLERHPAVSSFELAGKSRGSWGATLVELRDPPRDPSSPKP